MSAPLEQFLVGLDGIGISNADIIPVDMCGKQRYSFIRRALLERVVSGASWRQEKHRVRTGACGIGHCCQ